MPYNGFNGNNYDEDDQERAKAGGIVAGFAGDRNPAANAAVNPDSDLSQTLQNEYKAKLDQITSPNTNNSLQMQALDKLRGNIMSNQDEMDKIDDEASKDPQFADDYKNHTDTHRAEFLQKYPQYEQLLNMKEAAENQYNANPLSQAHMDEAMKVQALQNNPRFKNITDLLNK